VLIAEDVSRPLRSLSSSALSILIVDDDAANCEALSSYLSPQGHQVVTAHSAEKVLRETQVFDIALVDFNLGSGPDGLELAEQLITDHRALQAALITAARSEDYEVRAQALGIRVFRKPIKIAELDRWLAEGGLGIAAE
jgi:CheY-like chemotaxis protein